MSPRTLTVSGYDTPLGKYSLTKFILSKFINLMQGIFLTLGNARISGVLYFAGRGGGPCPMQVISAQIARDIQDFANEI